MDGMEETPLYEMPLTFIVCFGMELHKCFISLEKVAV